VIKTGHGGEVLLWNSFSVLLEDKAVGVSWVSDNDGLAISAGVIGHSFTNSNENLTIIFKKICTLHTWSSWLSSNHEGVVDILESGNWVGAADNLVEEWESAIVELSHDSSECLLGEWEINQVNDDSLTLAQEFS